MIEPVEQKAEESGTYESLTLDSGVTGTIKAGRSGNVVTLIVYIDSGLTSSNKYVCSGDNLIPKKYRPNSSSLIPGGSSIVAQATYQHGTSFGAATLTIYSSGIITAASSGTRAYAIISYVV